jgi:hypothetical protein
MLNRLPAGELAGQRIAAAVMHATSL